ncbi:MAG: acyl-ACP--UDP-N-acetylglucosamine O-acyltransferase [Opitutales bacterium]|nr:acyl-ACP--UDP-N-acetylglucosamine O-acyltransferase [Opitutales bacterium]
MAKIHPTAIVESSAVLADDVEIGAYAYIGKEVKLGAGSVVAHHATVDGLTTMGENNQVYPYAFVGGKTHDLKYVGGDPGLVIGNNNVFREYTTVHLATKEGENTVIGNNNNFLAYSHVAHDCIVGNYVLMSSHAALAGHVVVDDHAVIAWGSGSHQFSRIGKYAMVSAMTKQVKDLPPYFISDGNPASVCAINKINMQRNGFSVEEINTAYSAFKLIYKRRLSRSNAIAELKLRDDVNSRVIQDLLAFMEAPSERGLA